MTPQQLLDSEAIVAPDISHLVIEDDQPVDNFQSEKQQRLLVEPLYISWEPGKPFIAAANVGLFYALNQDGIAPDAFVSLDVQMPEDWSQKDQRAHPRGKLRFRLEILCSKGLSASHHLG